MFEQKMIKLPRIGAFIDPLRNPIVAIWVAWQETHNAGPPVSVVHVAATHSRHTIFCDDIADAKNVRAQVVALVEVFGTAAQRAGTADAKVGDPRC